MTEISNKGFEILGVTIEQFFQWCKENNKNKYKTESKQEFFNKILNGKLVKDENGNLVKGDK